jgi:formylglycine-generating enzyme required for sulfatase activity
MGSALMIPSVAVSQDAPEVVDSYPKQILKERAERRAAEREAARAAAIVNPPPAVAPVTAGSSPMGIEMVVINPGAGKLGSPDFEKKRKRHEGPLRDTYISYPFEVSKYEITFDDWDKCVSSGGCAGHKPKDKGWGRGKRPVIDVSFNDAKNFLKWLNGKTGQNYRLLSEAEWEYVARAGQDAPFSNGYDLSAQDANFNGTAPYGSGAKGPYLRKTQPVGQYAANAFGVHDMHGNVYEWIEDCYSPDHSAATGDGSARTDGDCKFRLMKGGSWVAHGYQARAAARIRYVTDYRYDDYGIRIARTLN